MKLGFSWNGVLYIPYYNPESQVPVVIRITHWNLVPGYNGYRHKVPDKLNYDF
jgi:hypothetical protein